MQNARHGSAARCLDLADETTQRVYISTLLDRVERETASIKDSFLVEEAAEAVSGRRQNIRSRLSKSMGEEYGSPLAQGKPRPSEFSGTSVMRD